MRSPFFMYFSATSASWAPLLFQQITRCHSVFSCFSPLCPVHCRPVARDNVATREPLLVLRTSGSAPKFPISMTLLRLRLTTDLQTLGGSGPRATTVYDPEVILSIKDTPLVLKFCRPPPCGNGSPEHHRIFDGPAVIARPTRHLAKPERLVQLAGRCVRRAHLEGHGAHAALRERLEHPLDQRTPHPLAPVGWRDPHVQDLALVGGVVCHDAARDVSGVTHRPIAHDEPGPPRRDARQLRHREHRRRDQRLHAIGVEQVHRSIHLSAQRIEARRHGLGPELRGGARGRGHERRNGSKLEPGLMREPPRSRPPDAEAGEAPGSVTHYEALEIPGPNAQPAEREVDEANDLGGVTAGSLHVRPALRRRRPTGGDTGDVRRGVDGEPNPAPQPPPSPCTWGTGSPPAPR